MAGTVDHPGAERGAAAADLRRRYPGDTGLSNASRTSRPTEDGADLNQAAGHATCRHLSRRPPASACSRASSGAGWGVVINLAGTRVREVIDGCVREARRAQRLMSQHQETLMDAWRRIHADMTAEEFAAAKARGDTRLCGRCATDARRDADRDRVFVRPTTGVQLAQVPREVEWLQHATPREPEQIEVTEPGLGIHFPRLDADLYVPALAKGIPGSRHWMALRRAASVSNPTHR